MRFPLEGQWSGREKCTLPLLRLTSAFLRKGANPSTMVSTSRTPPSRKRSRMTLRADGLRAVVLREVFFAMATSLRLRHHHSTITSPREAPAFVSTPPPDMSLRSSRGARSTTSFGSGSAQSRESALPPKATGEQTCRQVRVVPRGDLSAPAHGRRSRRAHPTVSASAAALLLAHTRRRPISAFCVHPHSASLAAVAGHLQG
jgi:hypothetical protein